MRGASQDRRRGRDRPALARSPGVPRHDALVRDEPDAGHDRPRPATRPARVPRAPGRSLRRAVPRRPGDDRVRRPVQEPRRVREVLQEGRRRARTLGGVDRRPRRRPRAAPDEHAAADRLQAARRPVRAAPPGVAVARAVGPHGRRGHAAAHDERRRPARPVLRVRTGQGRDGDRRPDRDVGGSLRAGDRLRDGASRDRRRRRRDARLVGRPRGRDGRRGRGARAERPCVRGRGTYRRRGREGPDLRRPRSGRGARGTARSSPRRS